MHRHIVCEMLASEFSLTNLLQLKGDVLHRSITAAVVIWVIGLLQLPTALAQSADTTLALPEVSSQLGEPLQARLSLNSSIEAVGEILQTRIAGASAFQELQIRRYQVVDSIELSLGDDDFTGQVLNLTTTSPLYEPSLRLVVSLTGDGGTRLLPLELLLPTPDTLGFDRRSVLVYPNDTLWRIADRTRDRAVTNNQQMLAVQRLNPTAFLGDNINGLKEWSMLSLPSFAEALEVPAREAAETVLAQHVLWQTGQRDSAQVDSGLGQTEGEVRITAVKAPYATADLESVDANAAQTFDESLTLAVEESVYDESLYGESRYEEPAYDEPLYEEQKEYQIEASVQQTDGPESLVGEREAAVMVGSDDAGSDNVGANAAAQGALGTDALASSAASEAAEAVASGDPYDLDSLKAQIREERGNSIDDVIVFLVSPQGIGLLSALTFAVLLVLLLLRRRAAEQERELDHALRGEEPLLADQPEVGGDLSGDEDGGLEDVYTTRLKLAEAYLEMGDTDGATEMLEEVIADGSPEQQEVARRIMQRVDNGDE